MGLFNKGKKTSSGLRTLTEDEIRRRLYGAYQAGKPDADIKTSKAEPQEPASPRSLATKEKEIQTSKVQDDLFEPAKVPAQNAPQEKRPVSVPEEISEQERMRRLSEIAEREKRRPPPYLKQRDPWQNPPAEKKQAQSTGLFSNTMGAVISAVGIVLKFLMSMIVFAIAFVAKLIGMIDMRKPEVRRALYWVGGAFVLAALFLSVHLLNVRREAAMRTTTPESVRESASLSQEEERAVSRPAAVSAARKPQVESARRQNSEALQPATEADERREERREEREDEEAPKEAPPLPPVSEGRYVIQVATYAGPEDANRMVEKLMKEGDSVFVRTLSRPSGKVYYALYLGRFESFQEAQLQLERFRKKDISAPFEDAFIRTLES